jgi:hypothetical protein
MIETEDFAVRRQTPSGHSRQLFSILSDNFIRYSISAVAAYALLRSAIYAMMKPFWFDEILTWVVSRQGSRSAMLPALKQGVDGNPPAFYLIERWAAYLFPDENIGYRFPAILAFACTLLFVFLFIKTRHGSQIAFVCSALLLLTPLFTYYAQEARPYSLLAALAAFAMVCYQRASQPLWTLGLSLSLVLATLLHYYAVLTLVPFFLAELAVIYFARRFRFSVWLALVLPLVPVALSWPTLMSLKRTWGAHFLSSGSLSEVSAAYGNYFRLGSAWGAALCVLTICFSLAPLFGSMRSGQAASQTSDLEPGERVLVATLIALPLFGFAGAKITHGAFIERYFMASIIGIIVAIASILRIAGGKAAYLSAALVFLAIGSQEFGFWKGFNTRLDVPSMVSPIVALSNTTRYPDLPIVLSNCAQYVEYWHYAPPAVFQRLFAFPDPAEAASYAGVDTADKIVLALRPYTPGRIQNFPEFVAAHPTFLLYSDGSRVDWWPERLLHDGYRLERLPLHVRGAAYLVEAPPRSPAAP